MQQAVSGFTGGFDFISLSSVILITKGGKLSRTIMTQNNSL
jgi:hypothetical protein